MTQRSSARTVFVLAWSIALAACASDVGTRDSEPRAVKVEDASGSKSAADGGGEPPRTPVATVDAGGFSRVPNLDSDEPLEARIQVNGGNTPCGTCSVLVAQAFGGKQPYSYRWSDPSLSGPGPHQVCPDAPSEYSVTVTDGSEMSGQEFTTPAQTATATANVDCTPPDLDAGTNDFVGCMSAGGLMGMSGGADGGQTGTIMCETGDGGFYSGTGMFRMPLLAGRTYSLSYDQLVPIVIGEPVVIDVYGSNEPCALEEKFATWTLDGSWHHPGCFTPTKNYDYLLIRVYVGFTLFYFELLNSATFCSGCSEPEQ